MGTNYYRIPKSHKIVERHQVLCEKVLKLDLWNPSEASNLFATIPVGEWERQNPWDEFVDGLKIHLGKRSGGWKFCWNFHYNKYYSNKDELFEFIREGRVVDEYGELVDNEEFIEMALDWCKDGFDNQRYYDEHPNHRVSWIDYSKYNDEYVDGLRVSNSIEFS